MGYTTLVVLTGTGLLGACSGMVGSFAVLRRRALLGDALSHAALPGVCLAFLIVGERHLPAMLFGAFLTGILGVLIVTGLRNGTRIKEDAAIGIVLSVFYGAGIALSRYVQNHTARGSRAGLETYILGKTSSMILSDVYFIAATALVSLTIVLLLYKEFQIVAFDAEFAEVQGWPAFRLDLLLMTTIAVTVVIGLPAVGVVLMAALLIIPAAAARFWTDRLSLLLGLSAAFGAATGASGTLISSRFNWAAGPSIVLVGTTVFLASVLLGTRRGILRQLMAEWKYRRQTRERSLLRRLFVQVESQLPESTNFSRREFHSPVDQRLLRQFERRGWLVTQSGKHMSITQRGLQEAAEATLQHRLIELAFEDSVTDVVPQAGEGFATSIPPELQQKLEQRLESAGRHPLRCIAGLSGRSRA